MKIIAIIPARMQASRFPNKPLATIVGMPMIGHCWHRTRITPGLLQSYIATCDTAIVEYADSIGAKAIMTADTHVRATERTAEAMVKAESILSGEVDAVLMVQGDEPLVSPRALERVINALQDPTLEIVNLMERLDTEEEFRSVNNVKVVTNRLGDALYFSREAIPSPWKGLDRMAVYKQTGIIAFRREALLRFIKCPETALEQHESVDMNRVLENGGKIRMVLSDERTVGVDTPNDLANAEALMKRDPLFRVYAEQ